jgi:UDP-N-acetylglucosamine:LPS N-acetylglucosamine transferase
VSEGDLEGLPEEVADILGDPTRRAAMAESSRLIGRPQAAHLIAHAMQEAAR